MKILFRISNDQTNLLVLKVSQTSEAPKRCYRIHLKKNNSQLILD